MTSKEQILKPSISDDPVQLAKDALRAALAYQQDWQKYGVERVHLYFDDVEGEWLDEFVADVNESEKTYSSSQEESSELLQVGTATLTLPSPIVGKALLQKIKELAHLPRRESAKRCGYYSVTKNGKTRINLTEFYDAVLEAKGVILESDRIRERHRREKSFRASVNENGQIIISSNYTEQMGLEPGDEFEIKLENKHIHLKLVESSKQISKRA